MANPRSAHYSAMKAAIIHLTKNIAKTYGQHHIRANCVCPAIVISEDLQALKAEAMRKFNVSEEEALWTYACEEFGAHYFLERLGELREVAAAVSFLMSDQASLVTGAVLNVDGGTDF
ncbi:MAG: SDR family oxidoreductase [Steroidobacteraceae bacterium]